MHSTNREFEKGEIIFAQGDLEMCMYELLEGTVGIYVDYGAEGETLLTEIKPKEGAFFGELGLIDGMPRSATAVALEKSNARMITGENFGSHFSGRHGDVLLIMRNMSQRIRALTEDYLDACRAVSEAVDSEETGGEKSGWFLSRIQKFLKDYSEAVMAAYGVSRVTNSPDERC